jgi:hypothetical protein
MVNSLDDKSKEILEQVKSKLLLIEKMKKKWFELYMRK